MESCCPARRASRERGPSYRRFGSVLMVNGSVDCPDLLRDAGLAGRAGRWAPSSLFPRSYNVVPHDSLSLLSYLPVNTLDMVSNGIHKRVLKPGVWAPSPAFMDEQEELGE